MAAQPAGKAAPTAPSYLGAAEVADILHVSPKTVSRWAKKASSPFLKTLGGHRRYRSRDPPAGRGTSRGGDHLGVAGGGTAA